MTASYDAATNHQVGQTYDANGNPGFNGTYPYDVENHLLQPLTSGTGPQWTYDPSGKRVFAKTPGNGTTVATACEIYFYGITGQKLATYQCGYHDQTGGDGMFWYQVKSRNVYFGGRLMRSAGVTVVTDRLGSVRANSNGERMSYFPYGEERTSTTDGREKFGTYFRDPAANGGLDYADQRYYINASGRFLTPEPSRGTNAADPGSWSKYGYVGGDPVNLSDPTGLARCSAVGSFTTNSDPDNALNPVTTVEIQCTSFAGSVFADQFVTFPGGASPGDISNAESSLGTTVDQAERSNFMSVIEASRQRLLSSITDTCAKAIGAKNAARADKRLSRIKITLSDPGPIHVETDPSGHITGIDPNQYLAQYTSGFLRVGSIQFNSSVDWSYPANTFAIDQNGATVLYDATSGLAFQLGIGSMTANQFTDLILLHELAHSFGRNHPVDTQAYDQNIWSHCFQ